MSTIPINTGTLFQGGRIDAPDPNQGKVFLRYASTLTGTDTYSFQFPTAQSQGLTFGTPRSVFIDNTSNNNQLTVSVQGTQQLFPVPAGSAGWYRVSAIAGDTINVTSAGASSSVVEFLWFNFDQDPFVYYKNNTTNTAATIADGADVAEGTTTDAAVTNPALAGTVIGLLKGILTSVTGGGGITSNVNLNKVGGSAVQQGHGTANNALRVELPTDGTGVVGLNAGSNIVGKFGIDQTTPGTTNGVQVTNPTLAATQSGTWNVGGLETAGSAVTGGGLRIMGSDGTNARDLLTTTAGELFIRGNNAPGAATPATGLMVGGSDGTNYRFLSVSTGGNLLIDGNVASASADSGNPVKVGGIYNSTLPTFTNGQRGDIQIGTRGSQNVTIFAQDSITAALVGSYVADAFGTTNSGLLVNNRGYLFNGTTSDRFRSIQGAATVNTGIGVAAVETAGAPYSNITTATTTTVKSGAGILHSIIVNTPVASATITVYDNTAGSGTKIATITIPSTITGESPFRLDYDLSFATGLTLVTSGATDVTVTYR